MQRTKAPFRADEVGSLLRPPRIKEARAKREKGGSRPTTCAGVEDLEIGKIIRKQEAIGLKLATDGEFRRSWWHFDFLGTLTASRLFEPEHGIQFQGVQTKARRAASDRQARFPDDHPMLEHFRFLKCSDTALSRRS